MRVHLAAVHLTSCCVRLSAFSHDDLPRSPPTALCMLENIVELQPGHTVVQNGATSAVGQVRMKDSLSHVMRVLAI
jgi:hypothetical protein